MWVGCWVCCVECVVGCCVVLWLSCCVVVCVGFGGVVLFVVWFCGGW